MKRFIALALILILTFSMAFTMVSCKKNSNDTEPTDENNDNPTEDESKDVVDPVKQADYDRALALINEGKLEEAYTIFKNLGNFKNSEDMLARFRYMPKSMLYTEIYSKDGEEPKTDVTTSTTVLNDKGFPTTITITYSDGDTDIYYFTYDASGAITKVINDWNGELCTVEYSYDSSYNMVEAINTSDDGTSIYTYKYDSRGNMTEEKYVFYDGSTTTYTWAYDSRNRVTKKTETHNSGSSYVYEYEYDSNGNEIKCTYSYSSSSYSNSSVTTSTYDSNNNITKKTVTSDTEVTQETVYHYNSKGYLIKIVETGSSYSRITDYTYDENGNVIREKRSSNYSNDYSYWSANDYTYDANGNIIKDVYTSSNQEGEDVEEYTYDAHGNITGYSYMYSDGDSDAAQVEYILVFVPFSMSFEMFENISYTVTDY